MKDFFQDIFISQKFFWSNRTKVGKVVWFPILILYFALELLGSPIWIGIRFIEWLDKKTKIK